MDARISYHRVNSYNAADYGWPLGTVYACVVDVSRKETARDPNGVETPNCFPLLYRSGFHQDFDAAEAEAREWARSQGIVHLGDSNLDVCTGAEADIAANYPGGYTAYVRDGRRWVRDPESKGSGLDHWED